MTPKALVVGGAHEVIYLPQFKEDTKSQSRPAFNAQASTQAGEDFQIALLKLNTPAGTQATPGELAIVW